ncbi:Fc receptor-like protein 5 [Latimeria chalumnae]|uniref:Fc receptor-like protein 5 n=1 Tax=Latimeria chalumnae TaxID=7897 RepID=UPI0003C1A12C|nr:PREDICTED: Fc receptor-like protein 5 [Latimeria chalumnae]|eukprot:XP_005989140.1 PREDICTED: Fc receptor-like protein 5 [Latimeria chalumnae]
MDVLCSQAVWTRRPKKGNSVTENQQNYFRVNMKISLLLSLVLYVLIGQCSAQNSTELIFWGSSIASLNDVTDFYCELRGTGENITYNLFRDKNLEATYTSYYDEKATFSVYITSKKKTGEYKCKASWRNGEKYSYGINLSIIDPVTWIELVTDPSPPFVVTGKQLVLNCTVINKPNSTVQWFYNRNYINYTDSHFKQIGNSLVIAKAEHTHTGEYYCKVRDQFNDTLMLKLTSKPVLVEVGVPVSGVRLEVSPNLPSLLVGWKLNLTCSIKTGSHPIYDWYFNGSLLLNFTALYSINNLRNKLCVTSVDLEHSGTYKCVASDSFNRENIVNSSLVSVTVLDSLPLSLEHLTVAFACFFLLVLLIIFICCYAYAKKTKDYNVTDSDSDQHTMKPQIQEKAGQ